MDFYVFRLEGQGREVLTVAWVKFIKTLGRNRALQCTFGCAPDSWGYTLFAFPS